MKHTTNYTNTFIEVAGDCKADTGIQPPLKEEMKSIARMQYEFIKSNPYGYTSDDLLFEIYAIRNKIGDDQRTFERVKYFSKGQACMRSSDLSKIYGWGIHYDEKSNMAIYAVDSEEYSKLKNDPDLVHKKAMRSVKL
jgi:hypothetical protein